MPRKAKAAPKVPKCSRCGTEPVRFAGQRCPGCLPTAMAIKAGKSKGKR